MSSILCLAHYCDTHGPTPIMTCEGASIACTICFDEDGSRSQRRGSVSHSMRSDRSSRPSKSFARTTSTASENEVSMSFTNNIPDIPATPPESPRMTGMQNPRNTLNRDSSFGKTYDENARKRAIPCENCALTVPTEIKEQIPDGAPGSPIKSGQVMSSSPILRTRVPYERISSRDSFSPQSASTVSTSADDADIAERVTMTRMATASTISSIKSSNSSNSSTTSHDHFVDYTSTHDPLSSTSFSALRTSCLRTLSCETLPPSSSSSSGPLPSPSSQWSQSSFSSMSSSIRSSNPQIGGGGPIFFGDSHAGYTTAFIFRVPDPYARGRRRIYAFICLSTQKEGKAMQAFGVLSKAFRELAGWIQGLAEGESDKIDNAVVGSSVGSDGRRGSDTASSMVGSIGSFGGGANGAAISGNNNFRGGIGGGGYSRRGGSIGGGGMYMNSPKNRGLAELVGRPDFFLDLHGRFVALAAQLSSQGLTA